MHIRRTLLAIATLTAFAGAMVHAQTAPLTADIPQKDFVDNTAGYDYVKREVMIPMRDGVKLHTVIVVPKSAHNAPILLTRTPYDASGRAERYMSPHMDATCHRATKSSCTAAISACSRMYVASTAPKVIT